MTYGGTTYVVDTNTLSQIGKRRRSSQLFLTRARVPEEVLSEAEGFPDIQALRHLAIPTTASVLRWLKQVMATVPAEDTSLVDLYAAKGGADPLVIACALEGRDQESQTLDPQEWAIVTGDNAVRRTAEAFGLQVLGNAEFASLIDAQATPGTS